MNSLIPSWGKMLIILNLVLISDKFPIIVDLKGCRQHSFEGLHSTKILPLIPYNSKMQLWAHHCATNNVEWDPEFPLQIPEGQEAAQNKRHRSLGDFQSFSQGIGEMTEIDPLKCAEKLLCHPSKYFKALWKVLILLSCLIMCL